jgi:hypothetical protein
MPKGSIRLSFGACATDFSIPWAGFFVDRNYLLKFNVGRRRILNKEQGIFNVEQELRIRN